MKLTVWQVGTLLALALVMAGCGTDPRDVADAYATTSEADQAALNQEQVREQSRVAFELEQAEERETSAARVAARVLVIRVASVAGSVSLVGVMLCAAVGLGWGSVGMGKAFAKYADRRVEVMAGLIPLNKETRQYPAVLMRMPGPRPLYMLTYPDNTVLRLDMSHEADRQKVAAMQNVQFAGVIAMNAARASTQAADAMSMIRPPDIINGFFGKGEEYEQAELLRARV